MTMVPVCRRPPPGPCQRRQSLAAGSLQPTGG